ncbi:MAG TPA: YhjD/YihY/BrkB family envelope integrity protein [Mycobacteriales bacterium]|nr:YhjD/YihY/BrkB family envelope integrity protein [Mycobacteriales bacterium]
MTRQQHVSVLRRTVAKAWDDRVLGLSAEAAFWQLLSLAPLFLALLGSVGYLSGLLGAGTVNQIEASLLDASQRAFAPSVVNQIITPTVDEVLRRGRADVISVGFLLGLWAGSSATATFVNTVTIAYGMRDLRGAVRSRLLALWLYLLTVVIGIVLLPVMVLGPGRLLQFFPDSVRGDVESVINVTYWPVVALLLLVGLVTFYHLAPPRRLPWHRGFPGAMLAGLVFVGGTFGLREYINFVADRGFSYGALAAPIGALLFFYVLALAVLLGAELNATIEQTWPTRAPLPVTRPYLAPDAALRRPQPRHFKADPTAGGATAVSPDVTTDHSAADHSAADHSATDHSATDHSATDHSATDHSAADHSAAEGLSAGRSSVDDRTAPEGAANGRRPDRGATNGRPPADAAPERPVRAADQDGTAG